MKQERRGFLRAGTSSLVLVAATSMGWVKPRLAYAAAWEKEAFENKDLDTVMSSLGSVSPITSNDITIRSPELAENGAVVPVEISSTIPNCGAIAIMIDQNPFPLAAKFEFHNGAMGYVATRLRLAKSTDIRAIIRSSGKVFSATKPIKVTISGCDPNSSPFLNSAESANSRRVGSFLVGPMKIRASMVGDTAEIKCMMNHPMDTGFVKISQTGQIIPAHHITNVTCTVNGKIVVEAQLGGGISTNPYLGLKIKGAGKGDAVGIKWVDNQGYSNSVESQIS